MKKLPDPPELRRAIDQLLNTSGRHTAARRRTTPTNSLPAPRTVEWYRIHAKVRDLRFQAMLLDAALAEDMAGVR